MTETQFWEMIASARRAAKGNWEKDYNHLFAYLAKQTQDDLFHFTVFFQGARGRAFTPGVLCAAFLWYGGWFSSDSFLDFTDCLVASSQEVLERIIGDPDSLVNYPELSEVPEMHFGQIGYEICRAQNVDADALRQRVEEEIRPIVIQYGGREGLAIVTPENARRLAPNLFERFGDSAFS